MERYIYRKIEYYLYNFKNTDELIEEIREGLINAINVSGNSWRKGITVYNNTLENQVIKIIDNKKILEIKRWQVLNKKVLVFFMRKYPKYYRFTKLKYLEKKSKEEIEKTLNLDFKAQKVLKDKLIEFMYKNAKLRNLV